MTIKNERPLPPAPLSIGDRRWRARLDAALAAAGADRGAIDALEVEARVFPAQT
jgi:hypothetical protein